MAGPRSLLFVMVIFVSALAADRAQAQPLGTFSWQLQPYCNRLTFAVTHNAGVFTLDGFDDLCGAAVHAAATGVALLNPDGTATMGITVITPDGGVQHVDARLDLATLNGTWRDHYRDEGTFAFNGSEAGTPRSSPLTSYHQAGGYFATARFGGGFLFGLTHRGTADAPEAVEIFDTLTRYGGGGFNGQAYDWPKALIDMVAAEDWTPTANGTRLGFWTTASGTTNTTLQMLVDSDGSVGIGTGTARPLDRLQVTGDIRVGTAAGNGCLKNFNGGTVAGVCASDGRFKRDVTPFGTTLDRVAALRPVHFSWRADLFPERGFGPAREAGLIAQEVEQMLPELVTTDTDGYKAIDYSQLPLVAIQAIKELKARGDALEARLAALEEGMRRNRK